jgi:hypothetical protein
MIMTQDKNTREDPIFGSPFHKEFSAQIAGMGEAARHSIPALLATP